MLQKQQEEQTAVLATHEQAQLQVEDQHKQELHNQQQETKKKLMFEYSKQDKLDDKIRSLEEEMIKQVAEAEENARVELLQTIEQLQQRETELQTQITEVNRFMLRYAKYTVF